MTVDRDEIITDPLDPADIIEPRTSTRKMTAEIDLEIEDVDHMAEFCQWLADSLRNARTAGRPVRVRLRASVE